MKYYMVREGSDIYKVYPDGSWSCYMNGLWTDASSNARKWEDRDSKVCIELDEEEAFLIILQK